MSQYGLLAMLKVAEEICGEDRALNFNHFAGFSQSYFTAKVSKVRNLDACKCFYRLHKLLVHCY